MRRRVFWSQSRGRLPLPLDRGAVRCRTANVRDGLREAGRAWAFCHCLKVPGVCVWGVEGVGRPLRSSEGWGRHPDGRTRASSSRLRPPCPWLGEPQSLLKEKEPVTPFDRPR